MVISAQELQPGDIFMIDGDIYTVSNIWGLNHSEVAISDDSQNIEIHTDRLDEVVLLLRNFDTEKEKG